MPSRRSQKVAEAIREVVSMAILAELKDPRVRDVTVTYVEVSGDLRQAKVHVSVMGDETRQQLSLRGLQSAAGFLQARCAKRIDTRYTPRLEFLLDQGVKKSIEIARILSEVLPREEVSPEAESDEGEWDEAESPQAESDDGEKESGQSESHSPESAHPPPDRTPGDLDLREPA
jgi:ribosome-binding factor A